MLKLGVDLGSATAKVILLSEKNELMFKKYIRHNGKVKEVLLNILLPLSKKYSTEKFTLTVTGTAGMGLAKRIDVPFEQEVVALSTAIRTLYPEVSTLIELGGEDSKIVLFSKNQAPEMRMNGSCAGGTGSFIDQMATLLNIDLATLNELSKKATKKLYIAARCGVFAKTDVQALLNKGESKEDIAKSVFIAVANQAISTLLSGAEIKKKILFAGGPLTFLSELRQAFIETIDRPKEDFILPDNSEVIVAIGAAILSENKKQTPLTLEELLHHLKNEKKGIETTRSLEPLFTSEEDYKKFKERHAKLTIPHLDQSKIPNIKEMYIGIDAGSTTTKLILIDENNNIIDSLYANNYGSPLDVVLKGFKQFKKYFTGNKLKAVFATGYGEEFITTALGIDGGIVETMAHFLAGSLFNDKISFIVDVGGQDIKAIKIDNNVITDIQLNEACSSGTGSFIQTFADNLNMSLDEFVKNSLYAKRPVDLGTRCSVFMNSKVKEALKDGISIDNISAGLAYSVVKNALFKVIKIKNTDELGENIFVQGGTFKNDAVLRAFELLTKKNVYRLNITEYMGAFGAALAAKNFAKQHENYKTTFNIESIENLNFTKRMFTCNGCGNKCSVTQFKFSNNQIFYTGQRCDRFFSNKGKTQKIEDDFFRDKEKIIFNVDNYLDTRRLPPIDSKKPVIGIPRALSVYEHYPFLYTVFRSLGFKVVLSDTTTKPMFYRGLRTVTADNICLPGKITNGHIFDLIDKKVDRIFYPSIIYEQKEGDTAKNSYNCPIVTGYGEVLKKSIKTDIPIDNLPISFRYIKGLKKNMYLYLKDFGVTENSVKKAINYGLKIAKKALNLQREKAAKIIEKAKKENKPLIVILGRPYHLDPMVNNGIMDLIHSLGAYAISENAIPDLYSMSLKGVLPLTQWSYHNRLYLAADWVGRQSYDKIAAIQLNSFGCGPDAVVVDEVKSILDAKGKVYISIKIDEMSNIGAAKIRVRSVLESLNQNKTLSLKPRVYTKKFTKKDRKKTILVPYFAHIYSELLETVFYQIGYNVKTLKEQSMEAVDEGLKYVNNDMCYPAIVVIGDLLKAIKDPNIDPDNTVVMLTQTGGQCRASNYVPLLKKALIDAGYLKTPVITLGLDSFKDGFIFNPIKLMKYGIIVLAMADALMRLKLRTKPYEKNKGETKQLLNRLLDELVKKCYEKPPNRKMMIEFMKYAVEEFNKIEVNYSEDKIKRVGVVGEIYLKSNCFSNNEIVNWLEEHGYEVVLPTFLKFFLYGFFSNLYNKKKNIHIKRGSLLTGKITYKAITHYQNLIEKELLKFDRYEKEIPLEEIIKEEKNTPLPLYVQFGEGWLLSAEIVEMIKSNVQDVISLQPFGCISNHIVAKGVYRYLKDTFDLNLLLLDYEAGTSDVNVINRIKLFLAH